MQGGLCAEALRLWNASLTRHSQGRARADFHHSSKRGSVAAGSVLDATHRVAETMRSSGPGRQ